MRKLLYIFLFISSSLFAQDIGGDYYVATDGDDADAGTYAEPFLTWQKAIDVMVAGDTTYIRGGVYNSTERIIIDPSNTQGGGVVGNNGTVNNRICLFAYPGENPILDCRLHCTEDPSLTYNASLKINQAEYWHFKGFEIRNVYQCSTVVGAGINTSSCANMKYENLTIHEIGQRGIWYDSGFWNSWDSIIARNHGATPEEATPKFDDDTTYFINLDIYNVCDSFSDGGVGNAGDCIKGHAYEGAVYHWDNCRFWNYSDDGIDPSGAGQRNVTGCWTMASNKYYDYVFAEEGSAPECNGFKFTGADSGAVQLDTLKKTLIVKKCLALFCDGAGFSNNIQDNYHESNGYFINNTAYWCETGFVEAGHDYIENPTRDTVRTIIRNTLVYESQSSTYMVQAPYKVYTESNNTWDISVPSGFPNWVLTDTVSVSDADFVTTDSLNLVNLFIAERDEDNSLPTFPLRLAEGSDLINAGRQPMSSDSVDFTISYFGTAPDIGAFEWTNPAIPSINYLGRTLRYNGKTIIQ